MALFPDLLEGVFAIDHAADAVEFENVWYQWRQLSETVGSVRVALASLGLGRDARVGVIARNRPSAIAGLLAVVAEEACVVSINPLLPDERLAQDLLTLRIGAVVAEERDLGRPGVMQALQQAGTGVISLPGVLAGALCVAEPSGVPAALEPGIIIEMLTSGTTGTPKRIPLKRDAFEKSFAGALSYEKGRSADDKPRLRSGTQILSGPMTHIGGVWSALTCVLGGRKACILEKFTVEGWVDAVRRHRPKVAGTMPAGLRMILDAEIPHSDLASLKVIRTGAAPLDPSITAEFWSRYAIPVLQNYGATEFSGPVAGWTLPDFMQFHEVKAASVGRFQPGVLGRIIDPEAGGEVPAGEEGILEMKSAQFGNDGAWLRTTDRAIIDADGFLFIRGRADSAIIRGGFKVQPDDVARALEQHPAVREAVVVGLPDRRLGAVPGAVLTLRPGATEPSGDALRAFARDRLLPYQVPTRFLVVADIPRTATMKPALPAIRALFDEQHLPAVAETAPS